MIDQHAILYNFLELEVGDTSNRSLLAIQDLNDRALELIEEDNLPAAQALCMEIFDAARYGQQRIVDHWHAKMKHGALDATDPRLRADAADQMQLQQLVRDYHPFNGKPAVFDYFFNDEHVNRTIH